LSIADYAADMIRVGAWPPDTAHEQATALFDRLLPDGRGTVGHEFRAVVTEAGDTVGAVWFGPDDEVGRGAAFIWDVAIDAAQRGRGYARAAMEALEPLARSLGYDAIRLHVFGDNTVARNLYRSVGYAETDVTMLKRIG
jgi:ribosomal protein S18 acetylase RimI-like enzyme